MPLEMSFPFSVGVVAIQAQGMIVIERKRQRRIREFRFNKVLTFIRFLGNILSMLLEKDLGVRNKRISTQYVILVFALLFLGAMITIFWNEV